ncbi:MAG TPA: LysM domain-containing protein [Sedimenticola sp.]|nr:LysM domain-containing protein [Sedimenticola sp.]
MRKYNPRLIGLLLGLLLSFNLTAAEEVVLNPAHPDRYEVVRGDTLWDIAGRFLRDPWRWPDVWQANPQIANPHLIYPGDIIELSYVDGRPRLTLKRGATVKLTPETRIEALRQPIPAIPVDAIYPFLTRSYVIPPDWSRKHLAVAPYVVSFGEEHLLGSSGMKAYVVAIESDAVRDFDLVRPGRPYRDADTGEILGFEARYVSQGELLRTGNPATLRLYNMQISASLGDRVIPVPDDRLLTTFHPRAPSREINGSIISVLNGVTQIGQYNVVVVDRGAEDGLQAGDVLTINHRGAVIRNLVLGGQRERVKLPDEPAGKLMLFRTFPRVSFGLVMFATRSIHLKDRVVNP